jgi:hypothetical protein
MSLFPCNLFELDAPCTPPTTEPIRMAMRFEGDPISPPLAPLRVPSVMHMALPTTRDPREDEEDLLRALEARWVAVVDTLRADMSELRDELEAVRATTDHMQRSAAAAYHALSALTPKKEEPSPAPPPPAW